MMRAGLHALLSHWWRRPFQLVTLLLGLATATALWSGVQAINTEARASYDRAAQALGAESRDRIVARDGAAINQDDFVALRRAGWLVTPVVDGRVQTENGSIRLLGVDPFTLPGGSLPGDLADTALDLSFLTPPGQVVMSPATADRLAGTDLPPIVRAEGVAPAMGYADIGIAQDLLGLMGQLSYLLVLDDQPLTRPSLDTIAPDLRVREGQGQADLARLTDSFHLNLTAFGLLSFAVGLFIVRGAVGLAFEQRRPVFRTLRALGLSTRALLGLLMAELLVFAVVAGALGIALGYLIATLLLPDVAATLRGLYGASVEGELSIAPVWWLTGLGISVLGTAIAAGSSLWQVARLPLLAPAQPRAWAMARERSMRWQAVAALALAVLAVLTGWLGSGLVAGFAMLGALLIAAALALPLILHGALRLGGRMARGPVREWFWADTRQQLPGLSLALMALLLALATNIGVGTMVSSFRLTFTGWLDQRLASELYVTAEDEAQAGDLRAFLEERSRAVLPIFSAEGEIGGLPTEIYGVADHPTYRDNWPILSAQPDVWDRVAEGDGVLINEQLSYRDDLSPGDAIIVSGWQTEVAGIYSDYGNPLAQVLVGMDALGRFKDVQRTEFGVRIDPSETGALTDALIDTFGLSPDAIVDQARLKQMSLRVFERTFAVTGALNVLTLAVAGFAILTSLMTLATMRLPQLAPVWALGLTRGRLARLEMWRALLLAGLTMLLALPVGLLLAWVLLAVINVEAFGWRLPMHLFPGQWVLLMGLSLLAALLASLWPARRIARTPPADMLKVFANER